MAETPKSIKVDIDWGRQELKDALGRAQQVGHEEGLKEGRLQILEWLEGKYFADDAPDRGTEEAKAILAVAREAGAYLRGLQ